MANALCQQLYRPDGLVNQELISPSVLGNVLEYRGTLQSTGRIVTIKRLRFASEHTNEVFSAVVTANYVNHFPSALNLAPTRPQKHSSLSWNYYGG